VVGFLHGLGEVRGVEHDLCVCVCVCVCVSVHEDELFLYCRESHVRTLAEFKA
jgi:hypothetical protein